MANAPALKKTTLGDKRLLGQVPTRDTTIAVTRTFVKALEKSMTESGRRGPGQIELETTIRNEKTWENETFRLEAARYCLMLLGRGKTNDGKTIQPAEKQVLLKTLLRLTEEGAIGKFVAPEAAYLTNMKIAEWCRMLIREKPELAQELITAAQSLVNDENTHNFGYTSKYGTFFVRVFLDNQKMRDRAIDTGFLEYGMERLTHQYEMELLRMTQRRWNQIAGELGYGVYFNLSTGRWENIVDPEDFAVEILRREAIGGELSSERETDFLRIASAIRMINNANDVVSILETLRLRALGQMYLQEMFEPWLDNYGNDHQRTPSIHPNAETAKTMISAYLRLVDTPVTRGEDQDIANAVRGIALAFDRAEDIVGIFETREDRESALKQGTAIGVVPEGLLQTLANLMDRIRVIKEHGEPELSRTQVRAAMEVAKNMASLRKNLASPDVTLNDYNETARKSEETAVEELQRLRSNGARLPKHERGYLADGLSEISTARGQNNALLGTRPGDVFQWVTVELNGAVRQLRIPEREY